MATHVVCTAAGPDLTTCTDPGTAGDKLVGDYRELVGRLHGRPTSAAAHSTVMHFIAGEGVSAPYKIMSMTDWSGFWLS